MAVNGHSGQSLSLYLCLNIEVDVSHRTVGHLLSDITVCVLVFFLMVIGIVANVLAILAYKRDTTLQTPSNYLLMILSIFDVLLAITAQPFFVVWKVMELAKQFSCIVFLGTILSVNFFAAVSFLLVSLMISLERYYSVFHPMLHRNNANKSFFKIAVFVTAFAWLVFLLGTFFGNFHRVYFGVSATVVIVCLVSTAVGYARIFREISRRCHNRQCSIENVTDERTHLGQFSREKTTLMNMLFIIGTMTLFYAPIGGCALYALVIGRDWLYMNFFMPWSYLLVFASTAINPFLYGWKNRAMRRSIKVVLRSAFEETDV